MTTETNSRMLMLATRVWGDEILRRANTAIAALNDQGSKIPIISFHSVDGRGTEPIKLSGLLGADQPYYCVRVPTKRRTPEFAVSVEEVAAFYVQELLKFAFERVVFVGWSAGAVIALEVAQQLKKLAGQRRNQVPEILCLVAVDDGPYNTRADVGPSNSFLRNAIIWMRSEWRKEPSIRGLGGRAGNKVTELIKSKMPGGPLTSAPKRHYMAAWIERTQLSPTEGQFVMALYDAAHRYRPRNYAGPVVLFVATDAGAENRTDRRTELNSLAARWASVAHNLRVIPYVGDHDTFKGDDVELLTGLATSLRDELAAISATRAPQNGHKANVSGEAQHPRPSCLSEILSTLVGIIPKLGSARAPNAGAACRDR